MAPPSKKKSQSIDSLSKLQRRLPIILKALNDDPQLFLAAAANPTLAIEEIGYTCSDKFKHELELRLRFPEKTRRQLNKLSKEVFEIAGCEFHLDDADELHTTLFDVLAIAQPDDQTCQDALKNASMKPSEIRLTTAPQPAVFGREFADPLTVLEGVHAVMKPLLEYRRLEASEPRFASGSLYDQVRRGKVTLPVTRLRTRTGHDRHAPGVR